ncbi:MAG: hypothetical protein F4X34_06420 [Chloroflexi bacterium]|nr:hypothetical protein [Chloroflexota bacterium]
MQGDDKQISSISKARSIEEIAEFWDTHSIADYEDQIHEVEAEVSNVVRNRVSLIPEVHARVKEAARKRRVSPETLVNTWLAERLQQETKKGKRRLRVVKRRGYFKVR